MEYLLIMIYNFFTLILPVILLFVCMYFMVAFFSKAVEEYRKQNRNR